MSSSSSLSSTLQQQKAATATSAHNNGSATTTAAPAILPLSITTQLLQHRLNAGLGIAGGARGSLYKCAVQLVGRTTAATTTTTAALVTDLQLQHIENQKIQLSNCLLRRNNSQYVRPHDTSLKVQWTKTFSIL